MRVSLLAPLAAAVVGSTASAQTVLNYWDFSSMDDVVGGVQGNALGTPDMSVHATYGEAYPGSGPSLNTIIQALAAGVGGGAIEATVFTGPVTAMDFGMDSWAVSYWVYDDSSDGDVRGPRIYDFLDGTTTGSQVVGDATGSVICRIDDDAGVNAILSPTGFPIPDQWIHIVINVDRTAGQLVFFVDGVAQAPIPLQDMGGVPLSGNVSPTQDMLIGVINFGVSVGEAQNQGLDDLAFYDDILSAQDAMDLATAAKTPLSFGSLGTNYCTSTVNSTGAASIISALGSNSIAADDLVLRASNLPTQPGIFIAGPSPGQVPFFNGFLCVGTSGLQRFATVNTPANGVIQESVTIATSAPGGLNVAAGQPYYFQRWNRDPAAGGGNANFSDGIEIIHVP